MTLACGFVTLKGELATEQFVIAAPNLITPSNLPLEALHLCQDDGALESVHSSANTNARVPVTLALTVHANFARGLSQSIIVGEKCAAITVATKGLAWEETSRTNGA
jgi:hypothetical protein